MPFPSLRSGSIRNPSSSENPVVLLRVQVLSCRDLEAKDKNGSSDPFVTVSLLGKRFQTPVCKRNVSPVYKEGATFDFPIPISLGPRLDTLDFVVWDWDRFSGNDYLGEYSLPVNQWFHKTASAFDDPNNEHFSVNLISSRPMTKLVHGSMNIKVGFIHPPGSKGQPDFENTYNALIDNNNNLRVGIVMVEICGVKDLPPWPNMTRMGFDMDPFVKVSIGQSVQCTFVKPHDLNPNWSERLFFHVRQDDLSLPIRLIVFDRDKATSNDYVGEVVINIPSKIKATCDFEQPLEHVEEPRHAYGDHTPIITFRANYQPYFVPEKPARQER